MTERPSKIMVEEHAGMIACLQKLRQHGLLKTAHLLALGMIAIVPQAQAQTAPTTDTTAATYKMNCALCHGDDGAGTPLGVRFQVKDLRSKEVQEKPSKELAQVIHDGKAKMPAFGTRLNSEQILQLIAYIRQIASKTN